VIDILGIYRRHTNSQKKISDLEKNKELESLGKTTPICYSILSLFHGLKGEKNLSKFKGSKK
jgi:hypothetical protein